MDYEAISGAVDWADVLIALGVVALAMAGIKVAIAGARKLLGFIR